MITSAQVDQLVDLAMECELTDPIDWGLLSITENQAYQMMASSILDQFEGVKQEEQLMIAMATMTKLLVENFILNLKLKGAENVLKGK
jgi:hypothetical protein